MKLGAMIAECRGVGGRRLRRVRTGGHVPGRPGEGAMRASEEAANQLRSESADATAATVESVERYEVAIPS